jgi:hypothetical protein
VASIDNFDKRHDWFVPFVREFMCMLVKYSDYYYSMNQGRRMKPTAFMNFAGQVAD